MHHIRQPAVAGMFYPADKQSLKDDIHQYLNQVHDPRGEQLIMPKAIVVPHAGYIYSAPIAASAYKQIIPLKDKINRVILLGPSHRVGFRGLAVPESDIFNTPLGNIPIDKKGIKLLAGLTQVIVSEQAHRDEHSLEVQLPFLQEVLGEFSLIPLVVGDAERHEVAEVINRLWDEEHTLIVISTDLSHYHEYNEAKQLDRATSEAIENLKPDLIGYDDACGRNGLKGMMTVAKEKNLSVDTIDLRNSGDTAGDKNRVVGYDTVLMSSIKLSIEDQKICLQIAYESIKHGLQKSSAVQVVTSGYSSDLQQILASFVTLHKNGELRGCIGSLEAHQPLINDIAEHAYAAAFQDPRFPSLQDNEYEQLEVEISVLGKPEPMTFESEEDLLQQIQPNIDGLILEYGDNRGTFLPSVWEQLPDKKEFLSHLKMKANLPIHWWDNAAKISRYETFSFD
ncbi:MAG: AmmeMemoRadiSam system protein B [Woeseiaceae bacterium]